MLKLMGKEGNNHKFVRKIFVYLGVSEELSQVKRVLYTECLVNDPIAFRKANSPESVGLSN